MPVANRFVLDQIVGVLNVLSDDEVSMVRTEVDQDGFRELIRTHIVPDLKNLTTESKTLVFDSLRYFLSQHGDEFEDTLDRQQELPMVRPANARDFFQLIFDELFESSINHEEDIDWTISDSRAASQLVHN